MVLGTIEGYHQMYQIGLTVTLVLAGITVLLFFVFRIHKIVNDMTGITKRKELKLRDTGKVRGKTSVRKEKPEKKAKVKKTKKQSGVQKAFSADGSMPTEVLNVTGGSPTEVLNMPDGMLTESFNVTGGKLTEVHNMPDSSGAAAKYRQALDDASKKAPSQKALQASGVTERLKHAPDAGEIRITILQEIMYVHADEVIVV